MQVSSDQTQMSGTMSRRSWCSCQGVDFDHLVRNGNHSESIISEGFQFWGVPLNHLCSRDPPLWVTSTSHLMLSFRGTSSQGTSDLGMSTGMSHQVKWLAATLVVKVDDCWPYSREHLAFSMNYNEFNRNESCAGKQVDWRCLRTWRRPKDMVGHSDSMSGMSKFQTKPNLGTKILAHPHVCQ